MKTATTTSIIYQAANREQLLEQLAVTDIAIPAAHGRLRKKPIERWAACRMLAALALADCLSFPVSMQHDDKPDFLIQTGTGEIGLEATIAMSRNYAACAVLRDKEFPDAFIDMGLFRWGAPELTKDQMRAVLSSGRLSSSPYSGNLLERDWSAYIESCISEKQRKMADPGFRNSATNWLVIHDNLPMPSYGLEEGVELLTPLLQERWSAKPMFDEIFIEHTDTIVCIRKKICLPIPDLWSKTTSQEVEAVA